MAAKPSTGLKAAFLPRKKEDGAGAGTVISGDRCQAELSDLVRDLISGPRDAARTGDNNSVN